MKEPTHMRKGKTIADLSTGQSKGHESINEAKRVSRTMQKEGSVVRRVRRSEAGRRKTFPKPERGAR